MLRLICEETGQVIELSRGSISIGRKEGLCDVSVNDPSISGLHCQVDVSQGDHSATDGVGVRIIDLQSLNGTWVNNERVSMADLVERDSVRLGAVTFRVENAARPAAVLGRSRGAVSSGSRQNSEPLDDEDDTSSLAIEIELLGMRIGPMEPAVVAACVANGEFSRKDKARIVGRPNWMPIGTLLKMLNLDSEATGSSAEILESSIDEKSIDSASFDGASFEGASSVDDASPLGDIIESPSSILEFEVSEMSSSGCEANSEAGSEADRLPPEISVPRPTAPKPDPKVDSQIDPIAALAVARASVKPRVVVAESDRSWSVPSGLSIPFGASPKQLGAVLALLAFLWLIYFGFGGESSARLPLYGEIQGAGECNGLIVFRPGTEVKAPAAIAEIFKGRYFFTKLNGPLPGAYEVVIELSDLPPNIPSARTPADDRHRPATAAAPDPFSAAPPAAQMTMPTTVSEDSSLNLNFQFVPNS